MPNSFLQNYLMAYNLPDKSAMGFGFTDCLRPPYSSGSFAIDGRHEDLRRMSRLSSLSPEEGTRNDDRRAPPTSVFVTMRVEASDPRLW